MSSEIGMVNTTYAALAINVLHTTQLISDFARDVFTLVNYVVLSTAIGLFGVAANVINLCVFVKQGLNNSMNVSFFAMAISDMVTLITLLWLNVCVNPYIEAMDSSLVFNEVQYLTAGWPHGCSARITSWITAYITTERCLSIVLPLKIKQILTPKRTVSILAVIYVVNILTLVPEYSTSYFAWTFYPPKNRSMVRLAFSSNRQEAEGLIFTFHASFAVFSFATVVIFTTILIVRLKKSSRWRQAASSAPRPSDAARDKKTIALVILVAIILIVCYTPTVVFSIVSALVPEFSVVGRQSNIFFSAWSFAFLSHAVNSSINIFSYYKMSSKYRNAFWEIFSICKQTNSSSIVSG